MNEKNYFSLIILMLILSFPLSCSLPRIIIVKDPLTPDEHINLGVAYEKKGELDNAIQEYKKASRKLPIAYHYIGNIHFQKSEFDKAEKFYKKAIKKNPQHADSYNNLAWLYVTIKKNLVEAEDLARKAMALNPAKIEIYKDTLEKIISLKKSPTTKGK